MNKFPSIKYIIIALVFVLLPFTARASVFNPNFIISDKELTNYTSMTLDSINNFLRQKTGELKNYIHAESKKTAAEIIFEASWMEKINPKYLLVTLQKEQSLVEDPSPTQDQYQWASGWGVCDSCSKSDPKIQKYKGFKNQVEYAAGGTRFYLDHPEKFSWKTGQTVTIDGQKITLTNDATRALYLYTPHLRGNRNFWNIWQRWFGKVYPDGTLLQAQGEDGVWLIQYGIKRGFDSRAALISRYDPKRVIQVEKSVLDQYTTGTPVKFPNYSLIRSPKGSVCLIIDNTKRCIVNYEVFRKIGFNPEEIIDVGWGDFNDFIDAKPITDDDIQYPTGTLLQDKTTGGVWWVIGGEKHPIVDRAILLNRFRNHPITQVDPKDLEQYQKTEPTIFLDGTLIKSSISPDVYVISEGKRRPILSEEVFNSFGYDWNQVITTTPHAIEIHPIGKPLDIGVE